MKRNNRVNKNNTSNEDEMFLQPEAFGDKSPLLARIVALMIDSEVYQNDTLAEVKKNITAPLYTNKCLLFFRGNKLVGYVSWAFLTEEAEARYMERPNSLEVTDWGEGERIWIIDLLAPYEQMDSVKLMNQLRLAAEERNFGGHTVKFKRVYNDGRESRIQEIVL